MTLVEILEYAGQNGVELKIYNDHSFLFPKDKDDLYFLELAKEDRRVKMIINSYKGRDKCLFAHPECGDEKFKEWLHDAIEAFLHHEYYIADEKRTSEYSTPINKDLGILGE